LLAVTNIGGIMSKVRDYLYENRERIVNQIGAENITLAPQDYLQDYLNQTYPLQHGEIIGQCDMMHVIWARTLKDILWLGCLIEAKKRRGAFDEALVREVSESMSEALEIGKRYAEQRP
jgi:hypothetical protein